jgi:XTP/dITP diphosphohydrolase
MTLAGPPVWTLASSNSGKLAEYRALLADLPIVLKPLDANGTDVPDETGETFVENALIKARHAARITGGPAIADDSGLCVDALGGAPGVRSARYAGPEATNDSNNRRLLRELADVPDTHRQAAFCCVIVALLTPDDPAPLIATGRWPGLIATEVRGHQGFGYDPLFVDPELGLAAAELPPQQKNRVSHRGRASAELIRLRGLRG